MQHYNTSLPKISMPEYGRNVETMIKYCMTIPDRAERNRYAYAIVHFMARVKNVDKPTDQEMHTFWDHLALLSKYELDIDYPVEIIKKDALVEKPETIAVRVPRIRFRQYGLIVENLINEALAIDDADKRLRLLELCANHMKLQFHLLNKEADEDDNKIIHDLVDYVGPDHAEECYKVYLYSLNDLKENEQYDASKLVVTPAKKKKKKKKKKKAANA